MAGRPTCPSHPKSGTKMAPSLFVLISGFRSLCVHATQAPLPPRSLHVTAFVHSENSTCRSQRSSGGSCSWTALAAGGTVQIFTRTQQQRTLSRTIARPITKKAINMASMFPSTHLLITLASACGRWQRTTSDRSASGNTWITGFSLFFVQNTQVHC